MILTGKVPVVVHLLQGLGIGGMERGTIQVADQGRQHGQDHRLVVFDLEPTETAEQLSPGSLPIAFVRRRPGLDLQFSFKLATLLRRWRVDILHARNDTALFYGCIAVHLVSPRPALVVTFHNFPCHPTSAARRVTWLASKFARAVTAVSSELSGRLLRDRWVAKCQTVWNGVDPHVFSPDGPTFGLRRMLGLRQQDILIGCLGRLAPIKRPTDLVEAAKLLNRDVNMPPFHVVFMGAGPAQEAVRQAAGQSQNISVLPPCNDVAGVLRELDLLVLCSSHEGAPRIVLESMAVGTPVIATAVGGLPEILQAADNPCGYLIPPKHPRALADAISRAARSGFDREHKGLRARNRILEYFPVSREWLEYQSIYRHAS